MPRNHMHQLRRIVTLSIRVVVDGEYHTAEGVHITEAGGKARGGQQSFHPHEDRRPQPSSPHPSSVRTLSESYMMLNIPSWKVATRPKGASQASNCASAGGQVQDHYMHQLRRIVTLSVSVMLARTFRPSIYVSCKTNKRA